MKQDEIAEKLDISASYYSQIENGDRQTDMSLSMMRKLAEVFGVPIGYIVAEEEKNAADKSTA